MHSANYGIVKTELAWCSFLCTTKNNSLLYLSIANTAKEQAFRKLVDFAAEHDYELGENVTADLELTKQLHRFASGEPEKFAGLRIESSHLSEFESKVMNAVRRIGYGKTKSYGDVAAQAGSPRAARAVGTVMRKNRTPLVIPCHRVLASTGIGGYSAADGIAMKRRLLAMEGVHVE